MKHICSIVLLFMSLFCMAQTNPRTQTPQQLAEQMTTTISQDVTLTATQQSQLTAAAVQYFTSLRSMAQNTPEERVQLYQSFQQTVQTIMTPEVYEQWQQVLASRREQQMQGASSNQ